MEKSVGTREVEKKTLLRMIEVKWGGEIEETRVENFEVILGFVSMRDCVADSFRHERVVCCKESGALWRESGRRDDTKGPDLYALKNSTEAGRCKSVVLTEPA